jgi:tRNA (cmo5U34)-methyltransferase
MDRMMAKDKIYRAPQNPVAPFQFDRQVAVVFDDMIRRSVPCYDEIICRQVQLIERWYQPDTRIYDLGCSTGNLGIGVCRHFGQRPFSMIAVDQSTDMLNVFQQRLATEPQARKIQMVCQDLRQTRIEQASVVILNFTLQFVPLAERDPLVRTLFNGLRSAGVLLLCEKITHHEPQLAQLQKDFHHNFKRANGYSELEISQKRDALENVLIPETIDAHLLRLEEAGFGAIDIWLKWFNFAAFLAVKKTGAP